MSSTILRRYAALGTGLVLFGSVPAFAGPANTTSIEETVADVTGLFSTPEQRAALAEVANDSSCVPAPEHPTPVVFLHGTVLDAASFEPAARRLHNAGECAWALDHGRAPRTALNVFPSAQATGDLDDSAREIAGDVDKILALTGAVKVDLVGHSQGGLQAKKFVAEGRGTKVRRVVTAGADFRGTQMGESFARWRAVAPRLQALLYSPAIVQQVADSPQVMALNALPDTQAGIVYTSLHSATDETARSAATSILEAVPGASVANVEITRACGVEVRHIAMPRDKTVGALIQWGLERDAANTTPTCV